MLVTGATILNRITQELKNRGFKEGSEITREDVRKAVMKLGFYDKRTTEKYWQLLFEFGYLKEQEEIIMEDEFIILCDGYDEAGNPINPVTKPTGRKKKKVIKKIVVVHL